MFENDFNARQYSAVDGIIAESVQLTFMLRVVDDKDSTDRWIDNVLKRKACAINLLK